MGLYESKRFWFSPDKYTAYSKPCNCLVCVFFASGFVIHLRAWVGGGPGPLPCHHIPRRPSKITHCLWLRPAGLTSLCSLKARCNQIASTGPTSPSYYARHVCGLTQSRTHSYPSHLLQLFLLTTSNSFQQTGQFISGPPWLMRDVWCQQGKSLFTRLSWHCDNTANAGLCSCSTIYFRRKTLKNRGGKRVKEKKGSSFSFVVIWVISRSLVASCSYTQKHNH